MSMKEALANCFERKIKFWREEMGSNPKFPCEQEEMGNGLFVDGTIDDEGYAEWMPRVQNEKINFEEVEQKLGFSLNSKLKDYFCGYWFMELIGRYSNTTIYFHSIPYNANISKKILESHIIPEVLEKLGFESSRQLFEIGTAEIDGNDEYVVCIDNERDRVIYIYYPESIVIDSEKSLDTIINSFEEVF